MSAVLTRSARPMSLMVTEAKPCRAKSSSAVAIISSARLGGAPPDQPGGRCITAATARASWRDNAVGEARIRVAGSAHSAFLVAEGAVDTAQQGLAVHEAGQVLERLLEGQ